MLEYINLNRSLHIITIEDPIEFHFTSKKSIISQTEIGTCANFVLALRYVVRQASTASWLASCVIERLFAQHGPQRPRPGDGVAALH